MEKHFIFSVIISGCADEAKWNQSVESIVRQTIGFEEGIQLILVKDHSNSRIGEICESMQERYPENVKYISVAGVQSSGARKNAAMPYVRGRYVNFMEPGDVWSLDAFSYVEPFFRQYEDKIDVVVCQWRQHGEAEEDSVWEDIYHQNRIVDALVEYDKPQDRIFPCFFSRAAAVECPFDEELMDQEDLLYINKMLLKKGRYAVLREAIAYGKEKQYEFPIELDERTEFVSSIKNFFKRISGRTKKSYSSTFKDSRHSWYFETPEKSFWALMVYAEKICGYLPKFIQFTVMHAMKPRFRTGFPQDFSQEERTRYFDLIAQVFRKIDDEIICSQDNLWKEHIVSALSLKYGHDIRKELMLRSGKLYFHGYVIYSYRPKDVRIVGAELQGEYAKLQVLADFYPLADTYEFFVMDEGGTQYLPEHVEDAQKVKKSFGISMGDAKLYTFSVPFREKERMTFHMTHEGITNRVLIQDGKKSVMTYQAETAHNELIFKKYFLFSVIVPVYNTEKYLEETLESVVQQTIGFRNHIQLILVNNGSKDESDAICRRYLEMYPDNVEYVVLKENRGPCGGRNAGIPCVKGEYVNFLDSDDKWELDAFEKVAKSFRKFGSKVDVIACRQRTFDAEDKWYHFDYKFKKDRVIDMMSECDKPQKAIANCFIRSSCATKREFDEDVCHAEDLLYINKAILDKGRCGVLRSAVFYYRKRQGGGGSLLSIAEKERSWYFETMEKSFIGLFDYAEKMYGDIPRFVQYVVMHELMFRFRTPFPSAISEEERQMYKNLFVSILKRMDDRIICEVRGIWREERIEALSMKYGHDIKSDLLFKNSKFYFRDCLIHTYHARDFQFCVIDQQGDCIRIIGKADIYPMIGDYQFYAEDDKGRRYLPELTPDDPTGDKMIFGEVIGAKTGFIFSFPWKQIQRVTFYIIKDDEKYQIPDYNFIGNCRMSSICQASYLALPDVIVTRSHGGFNFLPNTLSERNRQEWQLIKELWDKNKYRVIAWRCAIRFAGWRKRRNGKRLWLFHDRFDRAGDNGEVIFQYISGLEQRKKNTEIAFVLSPESEDYKRMRKIGKVLPYNSREYLLAFATCDIMVSSQTFFNSINSFCELTPYVKDLLALKWFYLQHGVIKDNHADTQGRFKKNVDVFLTSSQKEADSMIKGIGGYYGYDSEHVKITGLARFDRISNLLSRRKEDMPKHMIIAPTWRVGIGGKWLEEEQTYGYAESFKDSEFFRFYNELLSDERVLREMRIKGYKGRLRLHPRARLQAVDFVENDVFAVETEAAPYAEEVARTSLLLTDYSSIAFDYAYVNIPCIYAQFDKQEFYANHGYRRGYFNFEEDGFGPVCYDYESTVQAILDLLDRDCVMDEVYKKRVEGFFAYRDDKNCERIYEEILKLDKKVEEMGYGC